MNIVVFTGSGVSAESGILTFRDNQGLWEQYSVDDVASIDGYVKDKKLVLDFYNMMRSKYMDAKPNMAHRDIAKLEKTHNVSVITQNVDNLHEQAGSTNVIHLHGNAWEARSEVDPNCIVKLTSENPDIHIGDLAPDGHQLRPNIVWFGESVPNIERAYNEIAKADVILVVGTSLQVYPAAFVVDMAPAMIPIIIVDPNAGVDVKVASQHNDVSYIRANASEGVGEAIKLINRLIL